MSLGYVFLPLLYLLALCQHLGKLWTKISLTRGFFTKTCRILWQLAKASQLYLSISDNVTQTTQPESYRPNIGGFTSASLAGNCSILFTSTSDVVGKVIPYGKSLNRYFVTPGGLVYTALGLRRKGEPHDFSTVIASRSVPRPVEFNTDSDRSGAFETNEKIDTDGLIAEQIVWRYPQVLI